MSETETGYQERHEATVAEVARLRGVVEAVQALADEWDASGKKLAPDDDWGASVEATLRGDFLQEKASALRAALAPVSSSGEASPLVIDLRGSRVHGWFSVPEDAGPVTIRNATFQPCSDCTHERPSSGEAESGEADLARAQAKFDSLRAELDVRKARDAATPHCPTCGSDGEPLQSSKDDSFCPDGFHTPAPVLSGGQADGEGRCEHGIPLPDPTRAAERVLAHISATGDGLLANVDGAPLYGRDLESVAKAVLAARPVPSREALARLLGEHAPVYDYRDGRFTMECEACDFKMGGVDREDMKRRFGEHFAGLVLAGGEQACSSCGGSMDSPGCCTSPETKVSHPQGFHTVGGGCKAADSGESRG